MYVIYTDGACSGNGSSDQCPGGYGYVVLDKENEVTIEGGGHRHGTTNNYMELTAVVEGLNKLKHYIEVNQLTSDTKCTIITDSKYVCDNWSDYFDIWTTNGWKKTDGSSVSHIPLWKEIGKKTSEFKSIEFKWVKGHANNANNMRADELARSYISLFTTAPSR